MSHFMSEDAQQSIGVADQPTGHPHLPLRPIGGAVVYLGAGDGERDLVGVGQPLAAKGPRRAQERVGRYDRISA